MYITAYVLGVIMVLHMISYNDFLVKIKRDVFRPDAALKT